ncbi:MAG: hypothetical protein O7F71_15250 [Gammaproteobacteria bacterium]|nr:hypothetical protein [Gammaproteobacteria bacterium]
MNKFLLTLLVVLLLSGCTTTKLVDHWQAENFGRSDLNNVLVVAVTTSMENRFLFEKVIEQRMLNGGLNSVTSIRALGDELPTKEQVEAYVAENEIDYIMATKLENVEVENDYVPPMVRTYYTGPYYPSYGHYYGGYGYRNTITLTREAYVDTKSTVILVTTIFDAKSGEPVWVGRSETFEPGSVANLASEIARSTWNNIDR